VDLKPVSGKQAQTVEDEIRKRLMTIPGANFAVNTFLSERIDETLSGSSAQVVVQIVGQDWKGLDVDAGRVGEIIRGLRGARDVSSPASATVPQLSMQLEPVQLRKWGLQPVEVLDAIRAAYQGEQVGEIYRGNYIEPIAVVFDPSHRAAVTQVADLTIRTAGGTFVPLRELATIAEVDGRYQMLHEQAQRTEAVTANVADRDLSSFINELKQRLSHDIHLAPGTYLQLAGESEAQERSHHDLLVNVGVALILVVVLVSLIAHGIRNLMLVLAGLPLAASGGVLAVLVTGVDLSLGSMVGFVALLGISLRNSILLIAHYQGLVSVEGWAWNANTAIEGAADRLAPILMTTLVTSLGVLPLAIGMGEPGREIEGPMAVVILGGLLTGMTLNLLVLPALALRYGRFHARAARDQSELRFETPPSA
jgi:Cu/Ag efflux pump CusA